MIKNDIFTNMTIRLVMKSPKYPSYKLNKLYFSFFTLSFLLSSSHTQHTPKLRTPTPPSQINHTNSSSKIKFLQIFVLSFSPITTSTIHIFCVIFAHVLNQPYQFIINPIMNKNICRIPRKNQSLFLQSFH